MNTNDTIKPNKSLFEKMVFLWAKKEKEKKNAKKIIKKDGNNFGKRLVERNDAATLLLSAPTCLPPFLLCYSCFLPLSFVLSSSSGTYIIIELHREPCIV